MTPVFVDWLRKEIGRGWLLIAATGECVRRILGIHHSQVTYRKAGRGSVASATEEMARLEFQKVCTDPLLDAMRKVILRARSMANGGMRCLRSVIHRCSLASTAEDRARADYHAGLITAEQYAEALLAEARENENAVLVLLAEGQVGR